MFWRRRNTYNFKATFRADVKPASRAGKAAAKALTERGIHYSFDHTGVFVYFSIDAHDEAEALALAENKLPDVGSPWRSDFVKQRFLVH